MVAIHGRWCGPNWTDGRAISARDYKLQGGDFKGSCIDALDCACREHDRGCSGKRGCTRAADARLVAKATWIGLITPDPVLRAKAQLVAGGISAAIPFRRG